mgnify:CR=1 FL=1
MALIAPFNFPLEIPVLQLMGALYMGNKPLVHVDHRVSLVVEEFVRLLHECGMLLMMMMMMMRGDERVGGAGSAATRSPHREPAPRLEQLRPGDYDEWGDERVGGAGSAATRSPHREPAPRLEQLRLGD